MYFHLHKYYDKLPQISTCHKIFVCFIICVCSFSQLSAKLHGQPYIDSLKLEIPRAKTDSDKVKLLKDISIGYMNVNPDEGISYGMQALALAERIQWKRGIARASNNIGANYNAKSNYPLAMEYYIKALKINEELGEKIGIASNSMNIGTIYYFQRNCEKALYYFEHALKIYEQLKQYKKIAETVANIGSTYSQLGQYARARENYDRALKIYVDSNIKEGIGLIYSDIGQDCHKLGEYNEALKYDFQSLRIYEELGDLDAMAANNGEIGSCYLAISKSDDNTIVIDSMVSADKTTNLDRAIKYLEKGIQLGKETGNLSYIIEFSKDISEAYSLQGKYNDAYTQLLHYTRLSDSVFSDKNRLRINDLEKQREKELNDKVRKLELAKKKIINISVIAGFAALVFIIAIVIRNNRKTSELLLNILPAEVAKELKSRGKTEPKYFENTTVIFTDFVDFTKASEEMNPRSLIAELDLCFKAFDRIIGKYQIEKIKTIGDSYMAVSGLPAAAATHAENVVNAAIEMIRFMNERKKQNGPKTFGIRIGIHSGGVIAGIVGEKKYAYDIWGDTVNTAARMEQSSEPGKINISETTHELVKNSFPCTYRGMIEAKNKGNMKMYFVA